jgi:hypothetical protein
MAALPSGGMARCPKGQRLVHKSKGDFCCPKGRWNERAQQCTTKARPARAARPAFGFGDLDPAKKKKIVGVVAMGGGALVVAQLFGFISFLPLIPQLFAANTLTGDFTVDPVGGTISWAAGDASAVPFTSMGFEAGGTVTSAGFLNPGNNNTFQVSAVSATSLTLKGAVGLVAETGQASLKGTNAAGQKVPTVAQLAQQANAIFGASLAAANALTTAIVSIPSLGVGAVAAAPWQAGATTAITSGWAVTPNSTKADVFSGKG